MDKSLTLKLLREEGTMIKDRKSEAMLRDLLTVLPTLKRHKVETEILNEVRKLRSNRTQRSFILEFTRKSPLREDLITTTMGDVELTKAGQKIMASMVVARTYKENIIKVSSPISRKVLDEPEGQIKLLRKLKNDVTSQIRAIRLKNKPPITEHTFREGVKVNKMAEVYLEPNTFIKILDKRVRLNMTKAKVPLNSQPHVGVEIEFAAKEDINKVCDFLWEAKLGKYIQCKRDSSIAADTDYPFQIELAIIAEQKNIAEVIQQVCDVLKNKLHIRIDKSCGLHVHLDMRNRKPEKAFNNLILMQRYLYAMAPANRKLPMKGTPGRVTEGFSQPIESTKWFIPDNHYWGVNTTTYNKFYTIEIRMHSGTTSARKINNFISFLLAITEADTFYETPATMEDVQSLLKLSNGLRKYIESRIATFAPQHKKIPNPSWMGAIDKVNEAPDEIDTEGSEVA